MEDIKIEYSVDMIRLKTSVYYKDFEFFAKKYEYDPQVDIRNKFGFKDYKHNFYFKDILGSFWMGYYHNTEKSEEYHNLVIEYNPNKVQKSKHLQEILKTYFSNKEFVVVSCDIAIDLHNVDMKHDIFWDKGAKKIYKEFREGDSMTIYMGSGANKVKIYDKAKEQGLKDDIKWTRYEVSMRVDTPVTELNTFKYRAKLPEIYIIPTFRYDFDLNDTDWCLIQGIVNGVYSVDQLGRKKREKIRTALEKQSKFVPDNSRLSDTLKEYVLKCLTIV